MGPNSCPIFCLPKWSRPKKKWRKSETKLGSKDIWGVFGRYPFGARCEVFFWVDAPTKNEQNLPPLTLPPPFPLSLPSPLLPLPPLGSIPCSPRFRREIPPPKRSHGAAPPGAALELEGGLRHLRELLAQAAHRGPRDDPGPRAVSWATGRAARESAVSRVGNSWVWVGVWVGLGWFG